jgi:hypothetical protein
MTDLADRVAALEKRLRTMQQNTAGATTATGGAALSTSTPQPIGTASPGSASTASRGDHTHSSTLAAQHDVAISSLAPWQMLSYDGTAWTNVDLTLAADTDTNIVSPKPGDVLVYGSDGRWLNSTWGEFYLSDWVDLIRYGDLLSTHRRDLASSTTTTPKTITAVWGLGTQVNVTTQGVRFWLTASAASTITAALYVGTSLSSLAKQGPSITINTTTATGLYAAPWSAPLTVTGGTTSQYMAVQLTQTGVAATLTWAGLNVGTTGPWLSGGQWYGTTTSTTAPTATLNASTTNALSSAVMPWTALY